MSETQVNFLISKRTKSITLFTCIWQWPIHAVNSLVYFMKQLLRILQEFDKPNSCWNNGKTNRISLLHFRYAYLSAHSIIYEGTLYARWLEHIPRSKCGPRREIPCWHLSQKWNQSLLEKDCKKVSSSTGSSCKSALLTVVHSPINAEEKAIIRQRLLCFFSEPSKKVIEWHLWLCHRILISSSSLLKTRWSWHVLREWIILLNGKDGEGKSDG